MIIDWLFPRNRGKNPPLNPGPSDAGVMAFADGVNWNPMSDSLPRWVMWTGSTWIEVAMSGGGWTEYSAISTIVGWSSFTSKSIAILSIGKVVFCHYFLSGTSNATTTSFTLPVACAVLMEATNCRAQDNSVFLANPALMQVGSGSNVFSFYSSLAGAGWTASGTKYISGEFFYQT